MSARRDMVRVGYISGLHGVTGWVKVFSYTDPPGNIFNYSPWVVETAAQPREVSVVDSKLHGSRLIARLDGIDDRDSASPLIGAVIFVSREQLPAPGENQYYWSDLVGLDVVTDAGQRLGKVERLFATGANDVMVVGGDRERLIPWIYGDVVTGVDIANGRITVVWDPDF